ncbi:glycosyltransferase family 4 protein [Dysgonomonas capnocytophagoides]|uniref:glycosyltransferase family 4 protein n=1 Tax=Dysgonomonas capnocytophagoides TaxID=45254 RepID=UPI002923CA79|nr:glycosyltransferase family 4 protein [Dysgonomonas capnocytophagoides]
MKIVYCMIDSSSSGGMERSICTKANYLADVCRYDITIITTDRGERPNFFNFSTAIRFIDLGINYKELQQKSFIKGVFSQIRKRKLHKERLEQVLNELKPDICISTCTHEFTILPRIHDGSRKIAEFHFCRPYKEIEYSLLPVSYLTRLKALWGEKNKYRYVGKYDAFVVLTEEDKKRWSEFSNVEVIPNVLSFYPENYSSYSQKRVISVGRLSPQKAFHHLVDIWKIVNEKHPDWVLDIYGEGREYDSIAEKIKIEGLSGKVFLHNPVQNIEDAYQQASIYVMSSLYEGFGLVLAEAMAYGLPCVSFDCPSGPSEIISNDRNGYIVPVGEVNLFAEKIISLIENEELRKQKGNMAHADIKRFLHDNVMPDWIHLFEKMKGKKSEFYL